MIKSEFNRKRIWSKQISKLYRMLSLLLMSAIYMKVTTSDGLWAEDLRNIPLKFVSAQQLLLTLPELSSSENGGTAVIGYDMQVDDGHNGPWRFVLGGDRSANTLTTSVFLTAESDGIESGLSYRVRYRAVNSIGEGPWSDVAYILAA